GCCHSSRVFCTEWRQAHCIDNSEPSKARGTAVNQIGSECCVAPITAATLGRVGKRCWRFASLRWLEQRSSRPAARPVRRAGSEIRLRLLHPCWEGTAARQTPDAKALRAEPGHSAPVRFYHCG